MQAIMFDFNACMYERPPLVEETLPNQIEMCRQRLILYKTLQSNDSIFINALKRVLNVKKCSLGHLLQVRDSPEIIDARKCDYISHWILRVAYSRTDHDSRAFFVRNELRWFKIRFNNMSSHARALFINKYQLTVAIEQEKKHFRLTGSWYKIYFTEVVELVKLRMYPMNDGYIFIPEHKVVFWFLQRLEKDLWNSFHHLRKIHPVCIDERLKTIISLLNLVRPNEYNFNFGKLELEQLREKWKNFPLCMKIQYENLQKNHHLKHFSRFQLGLFLKGIGLSLTNALELWKSEFIKIMSEEQFIKEHVYYFKHLYGVVGAKINYRPYNCEKIQSQGVGHGQIHGCPFKHSDNHMLAARLAKDSVSNDEIEFILALKKEKDYNKACTRYLECVHSCQIGEDTVINHPNDYFEKACQADVVDIEDLFASENY
ncbi:uncharacterized protein LOC103314154 [Tribolium castaneum]|uniref:DNA primase large subunit-like Protein n=1 Tax=Tribolium castaneum TaxID=7070 RepID=D6WVB2_TRICA|nr:PREDICTED: DNA primase large subunit [Tribolium castaneum]EFA07750.2 DNA primase large subunit-like Protein [Tribolium castaneum]|eukprot:XP_008197513.1 PREDICTED: DNA primase large subunit [Tribolium castaneum]